MRKLDFTIFTLDQLIDFADKFDDILGELAPESMYWDDPRYIMLRDMFGELNEEIERRLEASVNAKVG